MIIIVIVMDWVKIDFVFFCLFLFNVMEYNVVLFILIYNEIEKKIENVGIVMFIFVKLFVLIFLLIMIVLIIIFIDINIILRMVGIK